jgi:hypothetical protein
MKKVLERRPLGKACYPLQALKSQSFKFLTIFAYFLTFHQDVKNTTPFIWNSPTGPTITLAVSRKAA